MHFYFQPLTLDKRDEYERYLNLCPQITSDYSFVNLWAWRNVYDLEWSLDQDLIWIWQKSPKNALWAPIGNWEDIDWQAKLENLGQNELKFIRIPEKLCKIWNETPGISTELYPDPDHWDYVYSVQELIDLKGNRFHKKKNLLKQFMRKYDYIYYPLTLN
ncbi:MAG: phosphatidylglycerol lysyltransferase domain-containing protein, partial [Thermodesulfobacteriota bacterium]